MLKIMRLFGKKESEAGHSQTGSPLEAEQFTQPEKDKKLASKIARRYQSGVSFKQSAGHFEQWAELQRFWEGDQWPAATAETRNFPRPVTNHFASTIEQKVAALTYDAPELHFVPVETEQAVGIEVNKMSIMEPELEEDAPPKDVDAAEVLSHIAKYQSERIEFDELLDLGCRTAGLIGTGVWFFPWDNTVVGGGPNSRYVGDIKGYEVDPVDFYPGDPTNADIQTQPFIIMAERRPLEEVKEFYRPFAGQLIDMIQPERAGSETLVYDHLKHEQDESDYVDVIHCWWKEKTTDNFDDEQTPNETEITDGSEPNDLIAAIMQSIDATAGVAAEASVTEIQTGETQAGEDMFKETRPDVNLHYAVVCQDYLLRHEEYFYEHGLYPFAAFQWYPRRKSFWGKGEGVDLLPNQKEENRLAGIALLSAYNNGLPNMRYHPEWVNEHDIPRGPGGAIIRDRAPGGSRGIEFIQPPTPASHIPQLRESMVAGMKDASGVHEAWSGKAPSAQLNASAIIALQEAAGVRIRGIQRRMHRAVREIGKLWLAHWKEHFNEDRLFRITGEGKGDGFVWFNATHYKDMKFDVSVKSGAASPYSKALYSAKLDKMYEGGIITPEEYLELQSADEFPKAGWIKDRRERRKRAAETKMFEERLKIVETLAAQLAGQAAAQGVPITPEVLQQLIAAIEQAESQLATAIGGQQGGQPQGGQPQGAGAQTPVSLT